MHLLRVQVPDFRGLKNIDITFEKDFVPSIFPLGSQNGGGKSTLLQLIFVLLHCSVDDEKKPFIQNLLQGFKILGWEEKKIAIIDIWDGKNIVKLEFYCQISFEEEKYSPEYDYRGDDENINEENNIIYICSLEKFEDEDDMTTIASTELKCRFNNQSQEQVKSFLKKISQKIFLAAPSTQIFLFLPQKSRELLFKKSSTGDNNYYGILESARSELQGLFTYDFLAVELLIESFEAARDRDFGEAIQTGSYGNSYQTLIKDLNLLLGNKRINLNKDFSGVNFKLDHNGETIELYPEDLSHGELKRLSIYIWLKSRSIENAIVLMDEVEIAFHPDWQYQIISDLKEWAPSNQYILATHSYALCEALTPAHVKEIEPKLIKQES
ncbi:MAG: ATP-binding protein [Microcoleus sp. PH2017_07_MST_O_A]|uniref:AAA family ATPase n=1 Tax=unclassified Microcoleus TaxID=2642155 RepID=UPI001D636BD8|nr:MULTISPECIES: AAA family ATPase [unclassified Microcoleus]MCC3419482.1 ATP-binding protein [Microcoleus sp. PH2017_07_MST_O_A]MCC3453076.1 ATP-binding protein [Microcoleus sp. PH2017_08_TRC_O_A]MCC3590224.1 ATP-binding protein [Microcoleus sp. PH2017_28_MFU_U_A]TAE64153.1 MAG: ATP-binding protein [Oscillatoriales cyanobacterium]